MSEATRHAHHVVRALARLSADELDTLSAFLSVRDVASGEVVLREDDSDRTLYFVTEGTAAMRRGELDLGRWVAGDHFGQFGLIVGAPRAATVVALTPMRLLTLGLPEWTRLRAQHPDLGLRVVEGVLQCVSDRLEDMTDTVGELMRQRSLPRHLTVQVTCDGEVRNEPTGVHVGTLLPERIDGHPVVAALVDNIIVPLDSPLATDVHVAALTTAHWEGQRIYRRSAALMLLEAGAEVAPERQFSLGPSFSSQQWIEVSPVEGVDMDDLAQRLEASMRGMVADDVAFRHEWWTVAEAVNYFREHGWASPAQMLHMSREVAVRLVSCGRQYFLSVGALASRAKPIDRFSVRAVDGHLVLHAEGDEDRAASAASRAYAEVLHQNQQWLKSLGVHSAGDFNRMCVLGQVSETIRVAEGFHEKRFTRIADDIASRPSIRIVCVAGPSSSGKTTFIKRLRVQLQVNGLDPLTVSLDDYYNDRAKCPRDEHGEYDFEALEALDLALLGEHIRCLLDGQTVRLARFDFKSGSSLRDGGREVRLPSNGLLMLEGIHGLNPALLGAACDPASVFRIFIQPLASLAFDRLSRVNPSDLRLIRRIVRDRHTRNATASDNIARWPSVRRGEQLHIFPFIPQADVVFDTSLIYELSVLKVYAERYLLEVPRTDPAFATAFRLRQLIDRFVAIYPEHVPPTSILREFIGASSFEY